MPAGARSLSALAPTFQEAVESLALYQATLDRFLEGAFRAGYPWLARLTSLLSLSILQATVPRKRTAKVLMYGEPDRC